MEVLVVISACVGNILCFMAGARLGRAAPKEEKVKMPKVSSTEAHKARRDREAAQKEQERIEVILYNLENYNGTEVGQKDVPRG